MGGSQLVGFARRVQRIREQQQCIDEARLLGCQDARLPSAVRMAAQPQVFRLSFANPQKLGAQPFPISRCIARARRAVRSLLTKGQIVSLNFGIFFAESCRQGN